MTEMLFNPFDPAFRANPYPFYERLRTTDPVHVSAFGFTVLTRYDDVARTLRGNEFARDIEAHVADRPDDPRRARRERQRQRVDEGLVAKSILNLDPPDHTRLRRLVSLAFTPTAIERHGEGLHRPLVGLLVLQAPHITHHAVGPVVQRNRARRVGQQRQQFALHLGRGHHPGGLKAPQVVQKEVAQALAVQGRLRRATLVELVQHTPHAGALGILEVGYPVTRDEWAQVISGDLFTITCARHGRAPDCPRLVQSRHQWDIDPHARTPAHVSCLPLGNDRRRDVIPGRD